MCLRSLRDPSLPEAVQAATAPAREAATASVPAMWTGAAMSRGEVPDSFAVARWSRDADVATIARCILGRLKYEPHTADVTVPRQALEGVIKHEVGRDRRAI